MACSMCTVEISGKWANHSVRCAFLPIWAVWSRISPDRSQAIICTIADFLDHQRPGNDAEKWADARGNDRNGRQERFRMKSIMADIIRDLAVQTEGSEVLIEFPGRILSRRIKFHVPR